ncbi:MAG: potassium channel family protein [Phycisphaerae bacterium]
MERFAVIGLGRYGSRLATMLTEAGAEVVAIDRDKGLVEKLRDQVSLAVCMDATDEEALLAQGIDRVDAAIVGIGADFEASALTTVILKQVGVPRVISRATTNTRGDILSRIGADDIVNPEKESAKRWRDRLLAPQMMERLIIGEGYSLAQFPAPPSFHNKSLKELAVNTRFKLLVVAIRRMVPEESGKTKTKAGKAKGDKPRADRTKPIITVPGPDTVIQPDDVLLVIGSDEALKNFPTS